MFCVFIAVLTIAGLRRYAVPFVVAMAVGVAIVPPLVGWQRGVDVESGLTVLLVAFAMYGFFGIIRSNVELAAARSEVARLAAENERTRIARDLHDLLGHSLTTITVKAALARRLADLDPERAAIEIGEVEQLSRRALTDVRSAVAGYREVRLADELAGAREILRAAGIEADLPATVDVVDERLVELFGWVVREGVTNVVRHSRAHRCAITVGSSWVEIVDDGRGADGRGVDGRSAEVGSGIVGLRERVGAYAGTVEVGPLEAGTVEVGAVEVGAVDAGGRTRGWRLRAAVALVPAPSSSGPVLTRPHRAAVRAPAS